MSIVFNDRELLSPDLRVRGFDLQRISMEKVSRINKPLIFRNNRRIFKELDNSGIIYSFQT
jgi:hypothetical protein